MPTKLIVVLTLTCSVAWAAIAQDELAKRASWTPPSTAEVKGQVLAWVATQKPDEATQMEIDARWADETIPQTGVGLLEQVALTIAFVDPEVRPIVELCRGVAPRRLSLPVETLIDESRDPFERSNLRLYYAQWLTQHALYDEALEQLDGLTYKDVVDPASLLFYQSVVHHRLLNKDGCLLSLNLLLENEADIPRRYLSVAKLMEADIKPLEKDSLDEVSRLMDDIQRRLNFGRAGTRVRDEEEDVIAKLDKMIEDLEKQRQQAQQASGNANGTLQPSKPADDSECDGRQGAGQCRSETTQERSGLGQFAAQRTARSSATNQQRFARTFS